MTAKKPTSTLDQPWPYSHVSTPVLWGLCAFGAAGVLDVTDVTAWWVAAVGALAALVAPVVALAIDSPLRSRWYAGLLALSLGIFLTWTSVTTPWQRAAGLALVPGVIVFGGWWHVIVKTTDREAQRKATEEKRAQRAAFQEEWPALFALVGLPGITFVSQEDHEGGYTVTLQLPPTGKLTYASVDGAMANLLVAAKLNANQLKLERGSTSADFKLHRFTRDVLAETIPYEIDRAPKSINDPMPIGRYLDGRVCVVTFREIAALMVGLRGSGKSALLNTHLAYLTGCVDAVVWMIDAKGGRTARPWLKPFLEATTGRPALDWVATNDREMDAMLLGGLTAVLHRSTWDGEKVHPSPSTPAVVLIVEEASQVTGQSTTGNMQRAHVAEQVTVLGRSEAVDPWYITQRATNDFLGTGGMKSQLQLRYGLGVEDAADAARIFPDSKMAKELAEVTRNNQYPGVFLVQKPGDRRVLAAKGAWLEPALIPGVAFTNSQHRGDLDPGTAEAVHAALVAAGVPGGYRDRWDRYKARLAGDDWYISRKTETPAGGTAGETPGGTAGETPQVSRTGQTTAERLGLVPPRAETPAAQVRDVPAETPAGTVDETFAAIIAGWDTDADESVIPADETADQVPKILWFMLRIFEARDASQLHTQTLLDDLPGATPLNSHQLGRLMAHCGVAPLQPFTIDGTRARGYARDDVLRAIARAGAGGMPRQAFDWEP